MSLAQHGIWRKLAIAGIWIAVGAVVLTVLRFWPHEPLAQRVGSSRAVYARGSELLRLTLAPDGQYRLWVPLDQISPDLVQAVLTYEDRHFWWHPGVNPAALVRSGWHTASGQRRLGGSTVTMQLARRLWGIDSRSVTGKLVQCAGALWLEARYSKRQLLEAYLNTAPYGGNIEGVGAASLIYFDKPARLLTLPEALTLAVIPQNPRKRLAEGGRNPELHHARQRLWALWAKRDPRAARLAPEAQLVLPARGRSALPLLAPHATDMLLARANGPHVIASTLDLPMQRTLERVMRQYLKGRAPEGLDNASAMLLDARNMQVRAVVGSAAYLDANLSGQVNGTLAKRSPGSTLKPFIYALALDQGLLHPRTILRDAPTAFGPFSPENFDGRFAGPISAQDALTRSRNIPAVAVAAQLAKPGLHGLLRRAGVARLQSEEHYGLALVLGGGEVTMEELAGLYAMLVNAGNYRRPAYTLPEGEEVMRAAGQRLLSPEAAFITLEMLRATPRPDTGSPARPAVAWKTGTSWGFRDAWTAGVVGDHVLVVWVGHFDGSSNPALIGIEAAAPLFLRMVDALRVGHANLVGPEPPLPADLRRLEVCAATGGLPDALCPALVHTWFIAGKSPTAGAAVHRTAWIDGTSGKVVCGPQPGATRRVIESWDSELRSVFEQTGLPRRGLGYTPGCGDEASAPAQTQMAPVIHSPLRGVRYSVRTQRPQPVPLRADAAADARWVYWFVDDALISRVAPGESLPWQPPAPGRYQVRAVDDLGRARTRELVVEWVP